MNKIKILVIGDPMVGKSSIVSRLTEDIFNKTYIPTPGMNLKTKMVGEIELSFFDTSGVERYKNLLVDYYNKADLLLLVYDVTVRDSFDDIGTWMIDIKNYDGSNKSFIVVGTKIDLIDDRIINDFEGKLYADDINAKFIEVSAKNATNMGELIDLITRTVKKQDKKKKKFCCF